MVDRDARDQLAELMRHFASGRITNYEFEESCYYPTNSDDKGVTEIEHAVWCLYDDYVEHRLGDGHISPELRRHIARWVLFLKSDMEYEWPAPKPSFWSLVAIVLVPLAALIAMFQPYRWPAAAMCALYAAMTFFAFLASTALISVFSRRLAELMWWPIIRILTWADNRRTRMYYGDAYANIGIWPFYRQSDFATALSRPKLLCRQTE